MLNITAVGRPLVIVNAAMTADGKIDTIARQGAQISSGEDWERVDRLRAAADAIMVGGKTVLGEDPRLTVKSASLRAERVRQGRPENPVKVTVLTAADLPQDCRFMREGDARVIIMTTERTMPEQASRLGAAWAEVIVLGSERVDLAAALALLHQRGIRSLMVEGGGTLIGELLRLGLVDELHLYIAPLIFGGATAPTLADGMGLDVAQAVRLRLQDITVEPEGGIIVHYHVRPSPDRPLDAAPVASGDKLEAD
jgi:2,5-diamino-6-(ribosylamino)-4(3H)-pyrimidinone 5'-phosphate reductase